MIKVLSVVLSVVIFALLSIGIAGYVSNPEYVSSTTFEIDQSPENIWKELIDVRQSDIKKGDVESVDIVETYGELVAWQENLKNGGYRRYRMTYRVENQNLVIELTDSSYGLTGTWYFVLEQNGKTTKITINEESRLTDFKIRGFRYFFGRNHDLLVWVKYIKVGVLERLLTTP